LIRSFSLPKSSVIVPPRNIKVVLPFNGDGSTDATLLPPEAPKGPKPKSKMPEI
jgi:hypothetical protein